MKSNLSQKIFAFALFALMFVKVSAMHVYMHQDASGDDIENCNTCESAIENQNTELLSPATFSFQVTNEIIFSIDSFELVSQEIPTQNLHFRLFGRPPPVVL